MKTTKVILIAALMAFGTLGFAQTKTTSPSLGQSPSISAVIPLQVAMHNPGLRFAMQSQLSPRFLQVEQPMYTVSVYFNHVRYNICGSYAEWKRFFQIRIQSVPLKG